MSAAACSNPACPAVLPHPKPREVQLSRSLFLAGALILLLGVAGIAVPYFTTEQTRDVANVGPLHVQATEQKSHIIPPLLSEAAIGVGIVLMGVAFVRRP
jgi:hypothetical protein